MIDLVDALQWPGMITNVVGSWLLTSSQQRSRHVGFGIVLVSNACWIGWAFHASSYALIGLQLALVVLNIRGLRTTDPADPKPERSAA